MNRGNRRLMRRLAKTASEEELNAIAMFIKYGEKAALVSQSITPKNYKDVRQARSEHVARTILEERRQKKLRYKRQRGN